MLVIAYIPCGSKAEAKKIAEALVKEKLAACANIVASDSIFEWKGKLEKTKEWIVLAKTLPEKFDKLKKRVEKLHPYETPCIAAIPIVDINEGYFNWVKKQAK